MKKFFYLYFLCFFAVNTAVATTTATTTNTATATITFTPTNTAIVSPDVTCESITDDGESKESYKKKLSLVIKWHVDKESTQIFGEAGEKKVIKYRIYADYKMYDDDFPTIGNRLKYLKNLVIENIFNGDETQITSVKNLEYNTTYKFYVSFLYEDETESGLYELESFKREGEKKTVPSYEQGSYQVSFNSNGKCANDICTTYDYFNTYAIKPKFKNNTKLPKLTSWNGYLGDSKDYGVLKEYEFAKNWGYTVKIGDVTDFFEKLIYFQNCSLDGKIFEEGYKNEYAKIICDEQDDVKLTHIKANLKGCKEQGGKLVCSVANSLLGKVLLAKLKGLDLSVNVNRLLKVEDVTRSVMAKFLLDRGAWLNYRFSFGYILRDTIAMPFISYIKRETILEFKKRFWERFWDKNANAPAAYFKGFTKEKLTEILTSIGSDEDIITKEQAISVVIKLLQIVKDNLSQYKICDSNEENSISCDEYKEKIDNLMTDENKIKMTEKLEQLEESFLYQVAKWGSTKEGTKSWNKYYKNKTKCIEDKSFCYDGTGKGVKKENCASYCTMFTAWGPTAPTVIREDMANYQVMQIRLLKDFIGQNSKVSAIINGAEIYELRFQSVERYLFPIKGNNYTTSEYNQKVIDDYKNFEEGKDCVVYSDCGYTQNTIESWNKYLSSNFTRQEKVTREIFSSAIDWDESYFPKPYIYYRTGRQFIDYYKNKPWAYVADYTQEAFNLISDSVYMKGRNKVGVGEYLNNILHINHEEKSRKVKTPLKYMYHYYSTYTNTTGLHKLGGYYGFLKLQYMTGSIGGTLFYEYNYNKSNADLKKEYNTYRLPEYLNDTLALSRVHAEFSYLDDFLLNSQIVKTSNSEETYCNDTYCTMNHYDWSGKNCTTQCPTMVYQNIFHNANKKKMAVVRKQNGKKRWLVLAISFGDTARSDKINIPEVGEMDITSTPAGNLYEVQFVGNNHVVLNDNDTLEGKERVIKLLDDSKTFTLVSDEDESLENLKTFSDEFLNDTPVTLNTFTKTYTPSNTRTNTQTPSELTRTLTPSNTVTKVYTPSNTQTPNVLTKTLTPSNTVTKIYTPSNTNTKVYTPSNTATKQISNKAIIPILECITDNYDGTYTAYFGYENLNDTAIKISACSESNRINDLEDFCEQTSEFKVGRIKGDFNIVSNNDQKVIWKLKTDQEDVQTVTASSLSTKCQGIIPIFNCYEKNEDGSLKAYFGYNNRNDFTLEIPLGKRNEVFPSKKDFGGPEKFLSGLINNVFSVGFNDLISWSVMGNSVIVTEDEQRICDKSLCIKTDISEIKKELSSGSLLDGIDSQSEKVLKKNNKGVDSKNVSDEISQKIDRANKINEEIKSKILNFSDDMQSCDSDSTLFDNDQEISLIKIGFRKIYKIVKAIIDQKNISEDEKQVLLVKRRKILTRNLRLLENIPRYSNN